MGYFAPRTRKIKYRARIGAFFSVYRLINVHRCFFIFIACLRAMKKQQ